ncbi:MAG TPA: M48 family metalloprotease [Thermoanaerobaculia bacterium]|nr:M48 family metalloprotease [Thermoanaerobaculia bacterium]
MRRHLSLLLALIFALIVSAPPAIAQEVTDPELYAKSLKAAVEALDQFGAYDNPKELARVTNIGYRVAQASGYTKLPITFTLIDMPEPNAFSLPGGQVFITRGMLRLGLTDDMMAGLLGHEIAHVVLQHGLKLEHRATLFNVLSQALLIGVMISAQHNNNYGTGAPVYGPDGLPMQMPNHSGDMIEGAYAAGIVASQLLLRSYSREYEDQADQEGQRWAAGAGFSPDGVKALMQMLRERIPEKQEYGYWQTHPFFSERVAAATAREKLLTELPKKDDTAFREKTQQAVLGFLESDKLKPEKEKAERDRRPDGDRRPGEGRRPGDHGASVGADGLPFGRRIGERAFLRNEALAAWPQGPTADHLRLEELHKLRMAELGRPEMARDYGKLIKAYDKQEQEVKDLTPKSPLLATLATEVAGFHKYLESLYPEVKKVWEGGVYQTQFLATFLSNYPDAPEVPQAALALGKAYSQLGREQDAVTEFLKAQEKAPAGSEIGSAAARGLRSLAPRLDELGALERLATQKSDPKLASLAQTRLAELAPSYDEIKDGADYLHSYPESDHAKVVRERLNQLADKLYGEVLLYQAVGEHIKAIDRIQKILTYAPLSPAAAKLREHAVVKS